MALATEEKLTNTIRDAASPLTGESQDYDSLVDLIGNARFALLGEATHGTHEFYRARAEITKRLITEKGFTAVAVEADWPDAFRVNRYVREERSFSRKGAKAQSAIAFLRVFFAPWRLAGQTLGQRYFLCKSPDKLTKKKSTQT